MSKRILFLPGFGEDAFIFDELKKHFTAFECEDVNYRPHLDEIPYAEIDVWRLAKKLIKAYNISEHDILFVHSMGGYFSFVIRELLSCKIVLLASFSNPNKVRRAVYNKTVNLSIAKLGLLRTSFFQNYLLKPAKNKYYEKELKRVVKNFNTFTNNQLSKMMKLSFGEAIVSKKENPIRIHAKNDKVVRVPDEDYEACNLGHFCIILEAELVARLIKERWRLAAQVKQV